MNPSPTRLKSNLAQMTALLETSALTAFAEAERRELTDKVRDLTEDLEGIEKGFLLVGLLGGTGVGKSTIMNALAGADIASTSHRRPHTERILIYRHEEAPLPSPIQTEAAWQEITHRADAVKHVLLCDLPDFDSIKEEHRKQVLEFLRPLDVLVWVASPEKYADRAAYEFLEATPKASQNFYFVLNKIDLLFENRPKETGYEELERISTSFREHVARHGIDEPLLFLVSAAEAGAGKPGSAWNQFDLFRRQIFQQRDLKQIAAIKTANLDEAVKRLKDIFAKQTARLVELDLTLAASLDEIEEQRAEMVEAGRQAVELWLNRTIRPAILAGMWDSGALSGTTQVFGLLPGMGRPGGGAGQALNAEGLPEDIARLLARQFARQEDRLETRLLQQNLPQALREKLRASLNAGGSAEEVSHRMAGLAAARSSLPQPPKFRLFRLGQTLVYILLLVLLLVAVAGQEAWQDLLKQPGLTSVIGLVAALVHRFFSPQGLAALASFGLLNLYAAFRFYRRYRRLLEARVKRHIRDLAVELLGVWEETLDGFSQGLRDLRREVQEQTRAIDRLGSDRK